MNMLGHDHPKKGMLIDRQGRKITYLRLSITDRCNLRCSYCMPEEGIKFLKHEEILSYEELIRISDMFVAFGINKIRITGGEPLVRQDCMLFIETLRKKHPDLKIHITTNGVALLPHLEKLKELAISGINISLDSLDADRFAEITKHDKLSQVLASIERCEELKIPLKINTVVQASTTDEEILSLAGLTKENALALRFIELMPFNGSKQVSSKSSSLEDRLTSIFPQMLEINSDKVETSRNFHLDNHLGSIGIIEGNSKKFCASCNKVRITSVGMLKNCLYDQGVLDLRNLLRGGAVDQEIMAKIHQTIQHKHDSGNETALVSDNEFQTSMATIGG